MYTDRVCTVQFCEHFESWQSKLVLRRIPATKSSREGRARGVILHEGERDDSVSHKLLVLEIMVQLNDFSLAR